MLGSIRENSLGGTVIARASLRMESVQKWLSLSSVVLDRFFLGIPDL